MLTDVGRTATSKLSAEILAALACPRCGAALEEPGPLLCTGCATSYSWVGNVPCLVPEPSYWRARMVQQLDEYLGFMAGRLAALELEQRAPEVLPRTRTRLARIADGMRIDRALIAHTLEPLRDGALCLPSPGAFSRAPTAGTLALLACYEHVFRDWAWGEAEADTALRLVERLLRQPRGRPPEQPPRRLAVFGAGAGRLAVDLHRSLDPGQTLALDMNPLPLLIAERLLRGEVVEASEFPVAPRSESEVTVARELRCPGPVAPGLTFLLADGRQPPFPEGSIDLAVTPWFIDAVEADPRATAATICRVLKPGGSWINLGPLRFSGTTASLYTIEEIADIVSASGFDLGALVRQDVPYFASPQSGAHRLELVYGFNARKTSAAAPPAITVPPAAPAWMVDPRSAVPALDEWAAVRASADLAQVLLSMVDGQRSIADLADALGGSWGVEPRTLDAQLQAFLARLLSR